LEIQHKDGGLAQKLLISLLCQNEKSHPGRKRVKSYRNVQHISRKSTFGASRKSIFVPHGFHDIEGEPLAGRLMDGEDYRVNLTESQVKRFTKVFDLIKNDGGGADKIELAHFAKYVNMEATFHGSALSDEQFLTLIHQSGIDEDGDGVLSLDEFLHFLRQLFLSDLPATVVPLLEKAYYDEAALMPEGALMDVKRVEILFGRIGFNINCPQMRNVLGVIAADGDGCVSFDEFIMGAGMMKLLSLHVRDLNRAFDEFKTMSRHSSLNVDSKSKELNANELMAFLNVSLDEANEMVFLGDQDNLPQGGELDEFDGPARTIDYREFRDLVYAWT